MILRLVQQLLQLRVQLKVWSPNRRWRRPGFPAALPVSLARGRELPVRSPGIFPMPRWAWVDCVPRLSGNHRNPAQTATANFFRSLRFLRRVLPPSVVGGPVLSPRLALLQVPRRSPVRLAAQLGLAPRFVVPAEQGPPARPHCMALITVPI